MSTDTGHISAVFNASWALNNPERITDWGYRAMHGSVVAAKQIIQSYYADSIQHSYYSSCSTGGRQGLKEIQMYPNDFDGLITGAPAWWTSHLQPWTVQVALHNLPNSSPGHIPNSLFPAILSEILRQCDPQDGVTDGLILDPYACNFYPDTLLCTTTNQTSCLTAPQLDTLYHIYTDYLDTNQTFALPHLALGTDPTPLVGTDETSAPNPVGTTWVQNFLYNTSTWSYTDYSYATIQLADATNPGMANADHFDLSAFRDRGGKLIMYHGLADPLIPTGSSVYFYSQVLQNMSSPPSASAAQSQTVISRRRKSRRGTAHGTGQGQGKGNENVLDPFFRLFLVPGMSHCGSSAPPYDSAPWSFGQGGAPTPTGPGFTHGIPGFEDSQHDVLLALMAWVEEGQAPDTLVATKYVNDTVGLGPDGVRVQRQGLLCPYPSRVRYRGGDPDLVGSFQCQAV